MQATSPSYPYPVPRPSSGSTPLTTLQVTAPINRTAYEDSPAVWDTFVGGGFRPVDTTIERDALPDSYRKEGMLVFVVDDLHLYRLDHDLLNWVDLGLLSANALDAAGLLELKGNIDASGNPDYPAAEKSDFYVITVAGKVGGASGKSVDVGDVVIASADNAGGDEAAVGTSWFVLEHNLDGALLAQNNLSELTDPSVARGNLGLGLAAVEDIVPIDEGGTGQSTAAAAFEALTPEIKITYTGAPQSPILFNLVPGIAVIPASAVSGQATYVATSGPTVSAVNYTENNLTAGNHLTTFSFDDVRGVIGVFSFVNANLLTSLAAPALLNVTGNFTVSGHPLLTTLSFPLLQYAGGTMNPNTLAAITSISFPELLSIGSNFTPNTMALLTSLTAAKLVRVGGTLNFTIMAALTTISFPELAYVLSSVALGCGAALTTVSLPKMVEYGSTIAVASASAPNVTSVVLGTVGTLKNIAGATITLSGLALSSAVVNAILALLVSLDGTNGTTLWGSGKTLTINGGTNGAPTGQGITDKATLQGRGATVTTN